MAASRPRYLMDWRSTMTLIPRDYNTQVCGDPEKHLEVLMLVLKTHLIE